MNSCYVFCLPFFRPQRTSPRGWERLAAPRGEMSREKGGEKHGPEAGASRASRGASSVSTMPFTISCLFQIDGVLNTFSLCSWISGNAAEGGRESERFARNRMCPLRHPPITETTSEVEFHPFLRGRDGRVHVNGVLGSQ